MHLIDEVLTYERAEIKPVVISLPGDAAPPVRETPRGSKLSSNALIERDEKQPISGPRANPNTLNR